MQTKIETLLVELKAKYPAETAITDLDFALRAQAEAEATWKARMNHACVRLDLRSKELTQRSKKAVGADKARDYWMGFGYASAAEVVSQEYRAALAQAGGEG